MTAAQDVGSTAPVVSITVVVPGIPREDFLPSAVHAGSIVIRLVTAAAVCVRRTFYITTEVVARRRRRVGHVGSIVRGLLLAAAPEHIGSTVHLAAPEYGGGRSRVPHEQVCHRSRPARLATSGHGTRHTVNPREMGNSASVLFKGGPRPGVSITVLRMKRPQVMHTAKLSTRRG